MATSSSVEAETTGLDWARLVLAFALAAGGIVGFYVLADQPTIVRLGAILAGIVLALGVAWTSHPGQRLIGFGRESWSEVKRVTWPTGKETRQMTLVVFAFVIVMAIFLWLVDKSLEWIIYDLILRWK